MALASPRKDRNERESGKSFWLFGADIITSSSGAFSSMLNLPGKTPIDGETEASGWTDVSTPSLDDDVQKEEESVTIESLYN